MNAAWHADKFTMQVQVGPSGHVHCPVQDCPQGTRLLKAAGLQGMLKDRLLPRLAEASGAAAGPLWLHLADQLAAFEEALAPLRGLPSATAEEAPEAPLWAPGSCLEALTMHQVPLLTCCRALLVAHCLSA